MSDIEETSQQLDEIGPIKREIVWLYVQVQVLNQDLSEIKDMIKSLKDEINEFRESIKDSNTILGLLIKKNN